MLTLADLLTEKVKQAATRLWPEIKLPPFDIVEPPSTEFGDLSTALPLTLAKLTSEKPTTIAKQLKSAINVSDIEHIKEITVTEPGYLNFKIDYIALGSHLITKIIGQGSEYGTFREDLGNASIEHTSVNPNKAAHVGHLRNACLGDTLARILSASGYRVEVQNYIDDLGLQVADSVVAWETLGKAPKNTPIDKWLWRIYAEINTKYKDQPKLLERRQQILGEMEQGTNQTAKDIVAGIVTAQLKTFAKFDINYDLLVYEHDIVENHLWENLFEELKRKKLIINPKDGPNAGAWIVKFGETDREDKILVKSNGLLTYTAKDLAYALWKFGKLPEMPTYEKRLQPLALHVNVIDNRQTYPQEVIKHVMQQLGFESESEHYQHLAYGVVKLSDKAMKVLGHKVEAGSTHSMSGRTGVGVMVDDLLNLAIKKQIAEHQTEPETAQAIATGSIRYYMLHNRPEKDIIFDFDEALKNDGNTGVYLQYAYARCCNILNKVPDWRPQTERLTVPELTPETTAVIKLLESYPMHIKTAAEELDPSLLTDFAFELANRFASFYEKNPVLKADEEVKNFRLHLIVSVKQILENTLKLLGIPALTKI
ncbi:arginine--tRNA ligase [candidate division Kazan bacterium RIFCSPLOWO2_01_FULL_48_13]|uniref:Arginine--tRNA ligase n=1 Tax=candidate division Kazan bacterium RIFCSPLOWO2_01_FULL_48_13 TaxID=1798539 RepID=A0A1F4PQ12_UNCK3|nr:MAG: arginine--tRNA ligase [candidate division Kazan bacterium RIFCSPLOWO2_01_FULL_48_13]